MRRDEELNLSAVCCCPADNGGRHGRHACPGGHSSLHGDSYLHGDSSVHGDSSPRGVGMSVLADRSAWVWVGMSVLAGRSAWVWVGRSAWACFEAWAGFEAWADSAVWAGNWVWVGCAAWGGCTGVPGRAEVCSCEVGCCARDGGLGRTAVAAVAAVVGGLGEIVVPAAEALCSSVTAVRWAAEEDSENRRGIHPEMAAALVRRLAENIDLAFSVWTTLGE